MIFFFLLNLIINEIIKRYYVELVLHNYVLLIIESDLSAVTSINLVKLYRKSVSFSFNNIFLYYKSINNISFN